MSVIALMMKDEYWLAGACVLFPCFLLTPRRATLSTFFKQTLNSILKKNACTIAFFPHSTTLRLLAWISPDANTPPPSACIQTANVHFGNSSDGPFPSDNFFITEFLSALSYFVAPKKQHPAMRTASQTGPSLESICLFHLHSTPLLTVGRTAKRFDWRFVWRPSIPEAIAPNVINFGRVCPVYIRCIMLWTVSVHGADIGSNFSSSSFFHFFFIYFFISTG